MKRLILEKLNQNEAIRYMGYGQNKPDEAMQSVIDECEKKLLAVIDPKFVYKIFGLEFSDDGISIVGTSLVLKGN
ncbi:MAG: methionine synthase, partial [Hominimerdicola sp.]